MVLGSTLLILTVVFALFIALTMRETASGVRVFGGVRSRLDTRLETLHTTLSRVHIGLVALHVVQSFVRGLTHEVVHISLVAVKVVERALLRLRTNVQKSTVSTKALHARSHFLEAVSKLRGKNKTNSIDSDREHNVE